MMARGDWRNGGDEASGQTLLSNGQTWRVLSIAIHSIRLEAWRGPFQLARNDSSSKARIDFLDSNRGSLPTFTPWISFFFSRAWFLEFEERGVVSSFFLLWKN